MQVIADPGLVSGFVYNEPVADCPWLTHCGEAECAGSHSIPWHRHGAFEFMYLSHGRYTWETRQGRFVQSAGQVFIARPRQLHRTCRPPRSLVGQLWVGMDLRHLGGSGQALADRIAQRNEPLVECGQEIEPLLRALVRQVVRIRPHRAAVVRALAGCIVETILQAMEATREDEPIYSYPVAKVLEFMDRHLERSLSIDELTRIAGCGASMLSRLFGEEVGRSPVAHHNRLRLEAAREALRGPHAEIKTVAARYGFASTQYFSTCFRRAFNVTPREWALGNRA